MTRLVLRVSVIAALNTVGAWTYLIASQPRHAMPTWETSSVLRTMPYRQEVGVVILGSSHARSLSDCSASAEAIEHGLDTTVLNLGKAAAGPMPLRLYLEEFYARGNAAETLVYFADPWAFYNRQWNEEHGFLMDEPFEPRFFARCVLSGKSPTQLFRNARRGFQRQSFQTHRNPNHDCLDRLDHVSDEAIAHRINHLFDGPPSHMALARYAQELTRLLDLANAHNTRIVIATSPTLLGDLPGAEAFVEAMQSVAAKHNAHFYNFDSVMHDPVFFVDHDHLNASGVAYFAENYLRTAIVPSNYATALRFPLPGIPSPKSGPWNPIAGTSAPPLVHKRFQ